MKKAVETNTYQIISYISPDEKREALLALIEKNKQDLSKKLQAECTLIAANTQFFAIEVTVDKAASGHKLMLQLRKLLVKLAAHIVDHSTLIVELSEDKNWLLFTPSELAENSPRLRKLLQSVRETFYYDVKHIYGPEPQMLQKQFLGRQLSIIDNGDKVFLLDETALKKRINLNCQACTSQHGFGCCCGSPCNYSNRNLKTYKQHEKAIIAEMKRIEPAFYEAVKEKLASEIGGEMALVGFDGSVGECEGRCMLLVREDGMAKCLAHKYALEHQLPVYALSPLSCLLFPFEVIECITDKGKRILLFTGVVEDELAEHIGRWGSYKRLELPLSCIDESLCNESFKKEDYQSIVAVNKGLISYEFGSHLYEMITWALSK